jgi:capsular exopolysaccharide synthesis family protein
MDEIEKPSVDQSKIFALNPRGEILRFSDALEIFPEEPPHLLDYLDVVLKRRWAVFSCLLVVFCTTAIGTLKQKPVYRATALIEVNPEPPDVLNLKEVLQVGSTTDADTYRATQIQVLTSRSLAERVVQKLRLQTNPEFLRNRILFGLLESDPKTPSKLDARLPDTSSDQYRNAVRHFLDSVNVKPRPHTSLVELSFDSNDPNLAARVANQHAEEYINQNLQAKWDETLRASEWLSDRLGELKAKLEKSEDALQAYAQANSIFFVAEKQNLVNARLEQLETEYTKAQLDRLQKESLARLVQSGKVEALPGFVSDKLMQDLEGRLTDLRREYAKVTVSATAEYPKAVQIQKQIGSIEASLDRMKKLLGENVTHEYGAAVEHEKALAHAVSEQKKEVNQIAEKSIQYNIQKRETETNRQLYDALLQRLKESQVQAGLKASNIRIVDPAEVPKSAIKPRVALNLALGIVFGLMSGIGLAFFQEYLDKTVKTPDDVEKRLRLPSLALLPTFPSNGTGREAGTQLVPLRPENDGQVGTAIQTDPATVEAFRNLRTSILLSADPVPKVILITSAVPGEGKSTLTVNLGATLASLKSRVVIVDCEMRRPSCHRMTGVGNKPGFVQCLTGHVELGEAILQVPGIENLSVIPCGPIPPNPAEVLSSPRAGELLRRLRSEFEYEYVLVDSPPLLGVSDARILSILVDGVVLVVHGYCTPYDVVRRARGSLQSVGARLLGVALNNVDLRRVGYAYNYYRYGYGYVYASGSEEERDSHSQGTQNDA